MAIEKRGSVWRAKLEDRDGTVLSATFDSRHDAEAQLLRWKREKKQGVQLARTRSLTVDQFFADWKLTLPDSGSGWRRTQIQQYNSFVKSKLGRLKLSDVKPHHIQGVLNGMTETGKGPQMQRHVYAMLRKMFEDSIENFQYLTFNPVTKKLRPAVPAKEARHLNSEQVKRLLLHVDGKKYGLAIWTQLYLGLRVGELQALRWEDLDLEVGKAYIRRTWIRKTERFQEYPKGKRQHSASIPQELLERLRVAKQRSSGELVAPSPVQDSVMPYKWYLRTLKRYCREVEVPMIATHGLRHSTAEVYQSHGAQKDDLRELFAHSSLAVTERYIHGRNGNLEKVAKVIKLFG